VRFEFKSGIVLFCFSFTFILFGESRLLVSWCVGGWCGMTCGDKDRGRSRRSSAEDWGWSHRLGGTVCSLHRVRGDEEREFLGSASKPRSTVCEWFGLKTTHMVFTGLASKPVAMVSNGLASKPAAMVSSGLASKPAVTVSSGLASKPVAAVSGDLASKPVATVSSGLASKSAVTVSSGLASKPSATVSGGLASKPVVVVFSSLVSKLVATISLGLASKPTVGFLVEPQNQGGGGFSVFGPQNQQL
jgi:hypothetical protein